MNTQNKELGTKSTNEIEKQEYSKTRGSGALVYDDVQELNLITNEHPWVGSPTFIFTRNLESSIRFFYQQQETDICFAAMRALLMDNESDFKRLKEKYMSLERKIVSELKWAKDNPEVIQSPQKIEIQEEKIHNPMFGTRGKTSPFLSAMRTRQILGEVEAKPEIAKPYEIVISKKEDNRTQIIGGIGDPDNLDPTSLWKDGEEQTKLQLKNLDSVLKIGGEPESR